MDHCAPWPFPPPLPACWARAAGESVPVAKKPGDAVISGKHGCLPSCAEHAADSISSSLHLQRTCAPPCATIFTRSSAAAARAVRPGTVNGSGMLLMRAARVGKDTTLSQVGRMPQLHWLESSTGSTAEQGGALLSPGQD